MAKAPRLFLKVDLLKHELRDAMDAMVEQDRQEYGEMTPSEFVRNLIRREKIRRALAGKYIESEVEKISPPDRIVIQHIRDDSPLNELG